MRCIDTAMDSPLDFAECCPREVGCAGLLAILLLMICGCSDSSKSLIDTTDVKSPDGEIILRLVDDRTGGAAVSGWMRVYALRSNAPASSKKVIFQGSAMGMGNFGNFSAIWRGARLIKLSHTGGYVVECHPTVELSADMKVSVLGCNS